MKKKKEWKTLLLLNARFIKNSKADTLLKSDNTNVKSLKQQKVKNYFKIQHY